MSSSVASPPPAPMSIMKLMLDEPSPTPPSPPLKGRIRSRSRSGSPVKSRGRINDVEEKVDGRPKRDDFYRTWDSFRSQIGYKLEFSRSKVKVCDQESYGDGRSKSVPVNSSYEWAAQQCKAKVAAIIRESRRTNQKYRDRSFDAALNNDSLLSLNPIRLPSSIIEPGGVGDFRRVDEIFDEPQFVPSGNVRQGGTGNCWLLAAVTALAGTEGGEGNSNLLSKLCVAHDKQVGVYGFVFFKDGEWIYEVIDDKLALKPKDDRKTFLATVRYGELEGRRFKEIAMEEAPKKIQDSIRRGRDALYFSSSTTEEQDESWLPLFEKAFAKAHGDYQALESGCPGEGIEDLTGGINSALRAEDVLDKDRLWEELLSVNRTFLFGCSSQKLSEDGSNTDEGGLIRSHAYAVLAAKEVQTTSKNGKQEKIRLIKLRNPWGRTEFNGAWSDGSKEWTPAILSEVGHVFGDDGIFWISYKDFLRYLPYIDRTRLFTDEWFVASKWTCIPSQFWPQYSDTTFVIEVTEAGPTVLVLSTPDSRYYRGLEGRYRFWAHFKLYRDGENDYLVRSMFRSGSTRSCIAEMDLEPGKYRVCVRLGSQRNTASLTRDEVVRQQGLYRPEKLVHIVNRFEEVHGKAGLRQIERAIAERTKMEEKNESMGKRMKEKRAAREHNRKERRRSVLRMRRIADEVKRRREEKVKITRHVVESEASDEAVVLTPLTVTDKDSGTSLQQEERAPSICIGTENNTDTEARVETGEAVESSQHDSTQEPTPSDQKLHESNIKEPETEGSDPEATKLSNTPVIVIPERGNTSKGLPSVLRVPGDRIVNISDPGHSPTGSVVDDDFPFDSDIDCPPSSKDSSDDDGDNPDDEIFEGDGWNAVCAIGLRVYSLYASTCIRVEGEDWRK